MRETTVLFGSGVRWGGDPVGMSIFVSCSTKKLSVEDAGGGGGPEVGSGGGGGSGVDFFSIRARFFTGKCELPIGMLVLVLVLVLVLLLPWREMHTSPSVVALEL